MHKLHISEKTKNILIDFDGVIVDSNKFKECTIEKSILSLFDKNEKIIEAISYFNKYAGLSREKKLLRFFETKDVKKIMLKYGLLCKEFYSISKPTFGSLDFLNQLKYKFPYLKLFILSGGEKHEINAFLKRNKLSHFFSGLLCSEDTKSSHIKKNNFTSNDLFFGDSKSDLYAAKENNIKFIYISEFSSKHSRPSQNELVYASLAISNLSKIKFTKQSN